MAKRIKTLAPWLLILLLLIGVYKREQWWRNRVYNTYTGTIVSKHGTISLEPGKCFAVPIPFWRVYGFNQRRWILTVQIDDEDYRRALWIGPNGIIPENREVTIPVSEEFWESVEEGQKHVEVPRMHNWYDWDRSWIDWKDWKGGARVRFQ